MMRCPENPGVLPGIAELHSSRPRVAIDQSGSARSIYNESDNSPIEIGWYRISQRRPKSQNPPDSLRVFTGRPDYSEEIISVAAT